MKKFLAGLLWILCLTLAVPNCLAAETAASMRLQKTEGTVTVTNSAGKKQTLRKNMNLYNGSGIATERASYAWFSLDNTKAAKLDACAKAQVAKSGKKLELQVDAGKIFFNVTAPLEADETLQIRTTTIVTGIRGTAGWVDQTSPFETRVSLLEGQVTVYCTNPKTGQGTLKAVHPGETLTVVCLPEGGQPSPNPATPLPKVPDHRNPIIPVMLPRVLSVSVAPIDEEEVPGFVCKELAEDPQLRERVEKATDLNTVQLAQTADTKLKEEQTAADLRQKQIEKEEAQLPPESQQQVVPPKEPKPSEPSGPSGPVVVTLEDPDSTALQNALKSGDIIDVQKATAGKLTDNALTIPAGKTLQVSSGTMTLPAGSKTTVDGTVQVAQGASLDNQGTLEVLSANSLHIAGAFTNNGALKVGASGKTGLLDIQEGASFHNVRELVVSASSQLNNSGTLTTTGSLTTNGTITSSGKLDNQGTVTVESSGNLDNTGTLTTTGSLTTSGTITSSGKLDNQGTVTVESSGNLDNTGTLTNSSTLTSKGTITSSGKLDNQSTLTNTGSLSASGSVINSGSLDTSTPLEISGTLTASKGGTIASTSNGIVVKLTGSGGLKMDGGKIQTKGQNVVEPMPDDCRSHTSGGTQEIFPVSGDFAQAMEQLSIYGAAELSATGEIPVTGTFANLSGVLTCSGGTLVLQDGASLSMNGLTITNSAVKLAGKSSSLTAVNSSITCSGSNPAISAGAGTTLSLCGTTSVTQKGTGTALELTDTQATLDGTKLESSQGTGLILHGTAATAASTPFTVTGKQGAVLTGTATLRGCSTVTGTTLGVQAPADATVEVGTISVTDLNGTALDMPHTPGNLDKLIPFQATLEAPAGATLWRNLDAANEAAHAVLPITTSGGKQSVTAAPINQTAPVTLKDANEKLLASALSTFKIITLEGGKATPASGTITVAADQSLTLSGFNLTGGVNAQGILALTNSHISGAVKVAKPLTLGGTEGSSINGDVTAQQTLTLAGDNSSIQGSVTVGGDLAVSGSTCLMEGALLQVAGNLSLGTSSGGTSQLISKSPITVGGTVTIDGKSNSIQGDLMAQGVLSINGQSNAITGNVTGKQAMTLAGAQAQITGTVSAEQALTLTGSQAKINGSVTVLGNLDLQNSSVITGTTTASGNVTAAQGCAFQAPLTLQGNSILDANQTTFQGTADAAPLVVDQGGTPTITLSRCDLKFDSQNQALSLGTAETTFNGGTLIASIATDGGLTLNNSTVTGPMTVGKVLTMTGGSVTGDVNANGDASLSDGAQINGNVTAAQALNLTGAGTKIIGSTISATGAIELSGGAAVAGMVTAKSSLTLTGSGTKISGGTVTASGAVSVQTGAAISTPLTLTDTASLTAETVTLGEIHANSSGTVTLTNCTLPASGQILNQTNGQVTITGTNQTYTGTLAVSGGTLALEGGVTFENAGTPLTVTGTGSANLTDCTLKTTGTSGTHALSGNAALGNQSVLLAPTKDQLWDQPNAVIPSAKLDPNSGAVIGWYLSKTTDPDLQKAVNLSGSNIQNLETALDSGYQNLTVNGGTLTLTKPVSLGSGTLNLLGTQVTGPASTTENPAILVSGGTLSLSDGASVTAPFTALEVTGSGSANLQNCTLETTGATGNYALKGSVALGEATKLLAPAQTQLWDKKPNLTKPGLLTTDSLWLCCRMTNDSKATGGVRMDGWYLGKACYEKGKAIIFNANADELQVRQACASGYHVNAWAMKELSLKDTLYCYDATTLSVSNYWDPSVKAKKANQPLVVIEPGGNLSHGEMSFFTGNIENHGKFEIHGGGGVTGKVHVYSGGSLVFGGAGIAANGTALQVDPGAADISIWRSGASATNLQNTAAETSPAANEPVAILPDSGTIPVFKFDGLNIFGYGCPDIQGGQNLTLTNCSFQETVKSFKGTMDNCCYYFPVNSFADLATLQTALNSYSVVELHWHSSTTINSPVHIAANQTLRIREGAYITVNSEKLTVDGTIEFEGGTFTFPSCTFGAATLKSMEPATVTLSETTTLNGDLTLSTGLNLVITGTMTGNNCVIHKNGGTVDTTNGTLNGITIQD